MKYADAATVISEGKDIRSIDLAAGVHGASKMLITFRNGSKFTYKYELIE